jgi:hypothetical protein
MRNKNVKKLIGILFIIALSSLIIGYKIYNKPHVNVADKSADIAQTSNMLFIDFSTDETKANTTYLDKIIAVKGIVANIAEEGEKRVVTLQTSDDFGSVICYLTEEDSKNSTQIKEGQEVVLKGICTGFLMDVILVKCVITDLK